MQSSTSQASIRAELEAKIRDLRIAQSRMPSHWHERREQVAAEIDRLVDRWLSAS